MTIGPAPGQKRVKLDPLTSCVSQIHIRFDDTTLSTATCCFWKQNNEFYLVTNWHNVTGKDARTLSHIDEKNVSEPNNFIFRGFADGDLNRIIQISLDLYDSDQEPLWLEHPVFSNKVDVICIRLSSEVENNVFPINERTNGPITAVVSDDVFVLGFPLGISIETTALWKRATVASEPDFDIQGLPMIYVDTATSRGMSGSPVVRQGSSGYMADGKFMTLFDPISSFVGLYSGRVVHSGSLDAQLGIVWKKQAIEDIIRGNQRGNRRRWKKWE